MKVDNIFNYLLKKNVQFLIFLLFCTILSHQHNLLCYLTLDETRQTPNVV